MIRSSKLSELQAELPGHRFLLTFAAGLPVFELELEIRILAREKVSAVQEYVLRCISKGVSSPTALDLVLGIGDEFIRPTLAYLQSFDLIEESASNSQAPGPAFQLTEKGRLALLDLAIRRPTVLSLPCTQDGITGEFRPRRPRLRLAAKGTAATEAIHAVPSRFDRPALADIDRAEIQKVVREIRRADPSKLHDGEVLDILDVTRIQEKYRKVDIAVFEDDRGGVAFRILDRGARLREYEQVLAQLAEHQPEVLPVDLASTGKKSDAVGKWLDSTQQDEAKSNADALAAVEERLEQAGASLTEEPKSPEEAAKGPSTREQLDALRMEEQRLRQQLDEGLRLIDTEEHRRLMERAFSDSEDMVLIVSPWLTPDAVDSEMKRWLMDAIDRGVDVVIGWGYPDEGKADHQKKNERSRRVAEALMEQLRRPRKDGRKGGAQPKVERGKLRVIELGDTHEKVLVADLTFAVVSSFNWLSFRGQRRNGQLAIRQERGYRIGIPGKVKEIRDDILARVTAVENASNQLPRSIGV